MAHYAQINNNIVHQVLVMDNEWTEQEIQDWLTTNVSSDSWVQTSYNNNIRKQFAGIGMTYDAVKDKFIASQPFPSWALVGGTASSLCLLGEALSADCDALPPEFPIPNISCCGQGSGWLDDPLAPAPFPRACQRPPVCPFCSSSSDVEFGFHLADLPSPLLRFREFLVASPPLAL